MLASLGVLRTATDKVRPVFTRTVFVGTGGNVGCEFVGRRQRPPDEAKDKVDETSARPECMRSRPDELVRIRRFMGPTRWMTRQTKRAPETPATQSPRGPVLAKSLLG